MSAASKADQTIIELENEKNEIVRSVYVEKANNSDLATKLKHIS
mgnify:FL=1|jgi:hypothetical protein